MEREEGNGWGRGFAPAWHTGKGEEAKLNLIFTKFKINSLLADKNILKRICLPLFSTTL